MDHCLWQLGQEDIDAFLYRRQVSRWGVHCTMESLRELVKNGAIWQPDDSRQMDSVRRTLYRADPEVTVDLLELFVKNKCCFEKTLQQLLRTPRIRQHLCVIGNYFAKGNLISRRTVLVQDSEHSSPKSW